MTTLALGLLVLVPPQGGQAQGAQGRIWDRLDFYANGVMRGEATFDNVDGAGNEVDDRFRGRMYIRVGATYRLADELLLEGRLSTASDGNDANNPHWDFGDGDGFNGSGIVMDRLFLDWEAQEDIHVRAGKQPHAFVTPPIYGEFLWDRDVSPAGIAALWTPETGEPSFDARVAAYVAAEDATDEDAKVWGAQGNVHVPVEDLQVHVSTSFYDWRDTDNAVAGTNQGNSALTEDFFIWEAFASATMAGGPLEEMTGFLELMNNLDESDDDQGWVIGGQLGSSAWKKGNYNAFLILYSLDADAVFSPVAQDDTPVPGTGIGDGMDGVVLGGTYFWRDDIALRLWLLASDADGADDEPAALRIDLEYNVP